MDTLKEEIIKSDHDVLIHISAVVDILQKGQENHLEHHRARDTMMLSIVIGSVFTSVIAIGSAILAIVIK